MTLYTDTFSTPFGEFSVAVDENAHVVATAFGDVEALKQRINRVPAGRGVPAEPRLTGDGSPYPQMRDAQLGNGSSVARARAPARSAHLPLIADSDRTRRVREQVVAYCRGERRTFDLPLQPAGSAFQQRVWAALARIRRGTTKTYGEVARAVGSSPRAVGRANATNPICLIVPCHRVIGADGTLTGFAFGEPLKQRLLEFESAR